MDLNVLLSTLKQENDYISGEYLSKILEVSRNSVWKGIAKLKEMGYEIQTKKASGYKLIKNNELLNHLELEDIFNATNKGNIKRDFSFFNKIDSTNTYLKQTDKNHPSGYFVAARVQTKGRGRLNRTFHSLSGKGLYVSYLYKVPLDLDKLSLITATAACAVAKTIESFGLNNCKIKWPNDIYINNKKVCGILSEISVEGESGVLTKAIIGIGINVNESLEDFPDDIKEVATSMYMASGEIINRAELIYRLIKELDCLFLADCGEILQIYKKYLIVNRKFAFTYNGNKVIGTAIDITDNFLLITELQSGEKLTLSTGEIENI